MFRAVWERKEILVLPSNPGWQTTMSTSVRGESDSAQEIIFLIHHLAQEIQRLPATLQCNLHE